MPLLSVIVPTRDRPALLPRAVQSVLAQTEPSLQLIIVDANRASPRVCDAHRDASWLQDSRVVVIPAEDTTNAAAARNVGLAAASGDWIAYLDDDDAYRPRKLEAQVALARAISVPMVLCGAAYRLRRRTRLVQAARDVWRADELLLRARWTTSLLLHRAAPVRFEPTLDAGEDGHFAQRLIAFFDLTAVACVREPLVDVYQNASDSDRTNLRADSGWEAVRRIEKEFGTRYSERARRVFLLQGELARAKLRHDSAECRRVAVRLLRAGGLGELRTVANALLVASRRAQGRFVT